MTVRRFRRKPDPRPQDDQLAAVYRPGKYRPGKFEEDFVDLYAVARMAGAELHEVPFKGSHVLIAVRQDISDSGNVTVDAKVIRPGHYLAYSPSGGFLYESHEDEWRQFYDEVTGEAQG